jgi:hypothetical protein
MRYNMETAGEALHNPLQTMTATLIDRDGMQRFDFQPSAGSVQVTRWDPQPLPHRRWRLAPTANFVIDINEGRALWRDLVREGYSRR